MKRMRKRRRIPLQWYRSDMFEQQKSNVNSFSQIKAFFSHHILVPFILSRRDKVLPL